MKYIANGGWDNIVRLHYANCTSVPLREGRGHWWSEPNTYDEVQLWRQENYPNKPLRGCGRCRPNGELEDGLRFPA